MEDLSPQTRALLECARNGDELHPARRHLIRLRVAAALGVALPLAFGGKVAAGMVGTAWLVRGLAVVGVASGVAAGVVSIELRLGRPLSGAPSVSCRPAPVMRTSPQGLVAPSSATSRSAPPTADEGPARPPRELPAPRAIPSDAPSPQKSVRSASVPLAGAASRVPAPAEVLQGVAVASESLLAPAPQTAPLSSPAPGRPTAIDEGAEGSLENGVLGIGGVPPRDDLAEEARLVGEAQRELEGGGPGRALTLLAEYARLFPSGALAPESEALRVDALCAVGRPLDAQAEGARFRAQHPGSPLARRPSFRCAEASNAAPSRATR